MKSAYFHCIGGASGDMILGAIVDSGVDIKELEAALDKLGVGGYTLTAEPAQRGGVSGTRVRVDMDDSGRRKRQWQDFVRITQESSLSDTIKERSCNIFRRLAEAEAMVHGVSPDEVHLHELGEIDTLVDVVGSVAGLESLGVSRVYCSAFPTGSGVINTDHGMLPAPSPATSALFAMARAPVVAPPGNAPDAGEMVTPTGAAILTTLADFRQPPLNLESMGYGLGTRESRYYPNALALWIGEETGPQYSTDLVILETNVDDMTGELLGYVQERLFELGARDVWFTPIQMKKNRPATMISAIFSSELESQAVNMILKETSTLGVRVRPLARYESDREITKVSTTLGEVQVKIKRLEGIVVAVNPEYEDCRSIARDKNISLQSVYRTVQREAEDAFMER